MGIYGKIILIFTALASLFLFNPMIVCAQPLGFLSQKPGQKSQQKSLSSSSGRFIFGQISDSGKDKFMLDTFTGRLWRIAESGEIGMYLRSVPYRSEEGKYSAFPGKISDPVPEEDKKHTQ